MLVWAQHSVAFLHLYSPYECFVDVKVGEKVSRLQLDWSSKRQSFPDWSFQGVELGNATSCRIQFQSDRSEVSNINPLAFKALTLYIRATFELRENINSESSLKGTPRYTDAGTRNCTLLAPITSSGAQKNTKSAFNSNSFVQVIWIPLFAVQSLFCIYFVGIEHRYSILLRKSGLPTSWSDQEILSAKIKQRSARSRACQRLAISRGLMVHR